MMDSGKFSTWQDARKVVVIGAGTMGSGIAAHLANIGFEVSLLDLTPDSVRHAFDRAKAAKPAHFYLPETANKIRLGSISENLDWVKDADWVCEAIIEKLDAKRALFAQLDSLIREDAMISTNTSGLQIELLSEGRSEAFRQKFIGTHFFNPPRYLKLLELIPTSDTDPAAIAAMTDFLNNRVARRVVLAKDTPGFIANRYGMWAMFHATHVAEKLQLTIEQVDAITGPFLGRPRSGSFRLNDVVGLDIMTDIAKNLRDRCPDDPFIGQLTTPNSLGYLLEKGWIGEKTRQGFYRREGKELLSFDLTTHAYRERQEPEFATLKELSKLQLGARIREALSRKDEVSDFLLHYLKPCFEYANYLKEEISHNVRDFDRVMKWGFAWEMGPFEMMDAIGADALGLEMPKFYLEDEVRAFGGDFYKPAPEPEFATIEDFPILETHEGFRIADLGDGVKSVIVTSKMGTINPNIVDGLIDQIENRGLDNFVLTSNARCFSAGFDLTFFKSCIENSDWEGIEHGISQLQKITVLLGQVNSVAAVFGYTYGGGFELAMGCRQIIAHPESNIGLPEAKVGLLPGGAGTPRMRLIGQAHGAKFLSEVAHRMAFGYVSTCADDARAKGYLRQTDLTCYHPDRLIFEAKASVLKGSHPGSTEWKTEVGPLTGMIDRLVDESRAAGELTDHDVTVSHRVKSVFAKSQSFEDACALERAGFIELCKSGLTLARIQHMIENGKPLRN